MSWASKASRRQMLIQCYVSCWVPVLASYKISYSFPISEGIVFFRRHNEFSPHPSPLRQRCIMTHAMIWHSLRCGRLKSMSDTFQLFRFWFSCGLKHWRLKTGQLFLSRLCSNPDLYVISVLSDNLSRHAFPVRGSGLSQMTWRGQRPCHGAGISGR